MFMKTLVAAGLLFSSTHLHAESHGPNMANGGSANAWDGYYAGVTIGLGQTDYSWNSGGDTQIFQLEATGIGVFAGYNKAFSGWVLGAEAALDLAKAEEGLTDVDGPGEIDVAVGPSLSISARAGKPFGDALVYGFVGAIAAELETVWDGALPTGPRGDTHIGGIAGIGVDYKINANTFARFAVSRAAFETKEYSYCPFCFSDQSFEQTEVSLGLGVSF